MAAFAAGAYAQAPAKDSTRTPAPDLSRFDPTRQPDAQRTRDELNELFQRYSPALHQVLQLDPTLLQNEAYLEPYPALAAFLKDHPEVVRDPGFFVGHGFMPRPRDASTEVLQDVLGGLAAFVGIGMAVGLLVWLIRTLIDYKRWNRLARVQTEVHTKLMDRFSGNEELLAYIKSPAGARFLESTPITLDAAPRSIGAPLSRILWSVQGGIVLIAGGIGLQFIGIRVGDMAAQPLQGLGILAIALGLGFVISAIISYVMSRRLGLIESPQPSERMEVPGVLK
jgi:hypothetical protein